MSKAGKKGVKIGRSEITIDCLADDIPILSEKPEDTKVQIEKLEEMSRKIELQVSFEKTDVIVEDKHNSREINSKHGIIKRMQKFKYHGEWITPSGKPTVALKERAQGMEVAYQLCRNTHDKKSLSINTKLRHYKTVIKPEKLYAIKCITHKRKMAIQKKGGKF